MKWLHIIFPASLLPPGGADTVGTRHQVTIFPHSLVRVRAEPLFSAQDQTSALNRIWIIPCGTFLGHSSQEKPGVLQSAKVTFLTSSSHHTANVERPCCPHFTLREVGAETETPIFQIFNCILVLYMFKAQLPMASVAAWRAQDICKSGPERVWVDLTNEITDNH